MSDTAHMDKRLIAFIEFSGGEEARELSVLIKIYLEGNMFHVEHLSPKVEGTTLKVYETE